MTQQSQLQLKAPDLVATLFSSVTLDTLQQTIAHAQAAGFQNLYFSIERGSQCCCGGCWADDSPELLLFGQQLENEKEMAARLMREARLEKSRAKKAIADKLRKEAIARKRDENERKTYERLKKKFEKKGTP